MWALVQAALAYLRKYLEILSLPTLSLPPTLPPPPPSFKELFRLIRSGSKPSASTKDWLRKYRGPIACLLSSLLALVVFLGSWSSESQSPSPGKSLATQLMLAATMITFVPTVLLPFNREKHRVVIGTIEALAYFLTIVLLAVLRGHSVWNAWIGYAGLLVALVVGGGHLVEWYRNHILTRVRNDTTAVKVHTDLAKIDDFLRDEQSIYLSVPIGLASGLFIGWAKHLEPWAVIMVAVQAMAFLFVVALFVFLLKLFRRMWDPILRFDRTLKKTIATEVEHNVAYAVSELRKVYLYDSIHDAMLLVSFLALALRLGQVLIDKNPVCFLSFGRCPGVAEIDKGWLLGGITAVVLVLNQLPFMVGQSQLHDLVLDNLEGWSRAETIAKIKESLVLFPKIEFLAALFSSGTAGGAVWSLAEKLIKGGE
jgi:hypothetical protein